MPTNSERVSGLFAVSETAWPRGPLPKRSGTGTVRRGELEGESGDEAFFKREYAVLEGH